MTIRTSPLRRFALAVGAVAMTIAVGGCGTSSTAATSAEAGCAASPAAAGGAATGGHGHHSSSAPVPTQPPRPGERFLNLAMAEPYTPVPCNGGTDEYRCFLMDPQLTKPVFLRGSQFEPQNHTILHHANIYVVPPQNAAMARDKDASTPGQGWTCFGGDGLNPQKPSAWVDTWTPNGREILLTQNAGYRLEPGSLVILQVHYNLLATGGRPGESDRSGVRLRLTDGDAATIPLVSIPLMAPIELPCAPGESGPLCDREASLADVAKRFGPEVAGVEPALVTHCSGGKPVPGNTQHCDTVVPSDMTVYAGRGHMHLLGRSMKVELNPGKPGARTLLDVPVFDFDNQQHVPLPTPVRVKSGDTVRVTCTHDASLRKMLPQLQQLPPRYVVYGDGTSDEMCIGLMTVSLP